jgi:hypothetical protein
MRNLQFVNSDTSDNSRKHPQRAAEDLFDLLTGSGANPPGGCWGGAGWESEARRGFNGTRFLGMGPTNQQGAPQLITAIYWA